MYEFQARRNERLIMRHFVSLCLLALTGLALTAPALAAARVDSQVQITSPRAGQVFAPGDTVVITVTTQIPAAAGYVGVGAPGVGILQGTNYNGSTFQASFKIPESFAGPLTISPAVIGTDQTPVEGQSVTIIVRSSNAPERISLTQATFMMRAPGATENIYVQGMYSNGIERDLTSSTTGTAYRSSDTGIVRVSADGNVRATGFGIAIVSVVNAGRKAFASFWVEDPQHPLPPIEVTPQVRIDRLTAQITPFNALTSTYGQTLRVINASSIPLPGSLYVVISNLPSKTVVTGGGRTKVIEPLGSPYFSLKLPDGLTLQPGQSVSVKLAMWILGSQPINYDVRVFRTSVQP